MLKLDESDLKLWLHLSFWPVPLTTAALGEVTATVIAAGSVVAERDCGGCGRDSSGRIDGNCARR